MEIFNHIIKKKELLDENNTFETSCTDVHIAFGVDTNFVIGMGVSMTSIILNNLDVKINFHVITDGIDEEDIERLKILSRYENVKIYIYQIDVNAFKSLPTNSHWSYAIYYRFLIGTLLENEADKVLYLDADVLCIGSLQELIHTDMGDSIIAGVSDIVKMFESTIRKLDIKNGKYFNSGVMYIDIEKWNKRKVSEIAVELLCKNPEKYISWDQDVLNVILDGKVCFVDKKWDYFYNGDTKDTKKILPENVILIHFTGSKPWCKWTLHLPIVRQFFHLYMKKSPWDNFVFLMPRVYKEARYLSKSYKRRRKYLKAIEWYFKYLWMRTKTKCNW